MALDAHYQALAEGVETAVNPDYADLVTPDPGDPGAFHRWFRMKEAYSPRFLERIVKDLSLTASPSRIRILDPFAGSGTTAVSAGSLGRPAASYGIESNPFLHLLASAKQRSIQDRPFELSLHAERVLKRAERSLQQGTRHFRPKLSTFANRRYFPEAELRTLLALVRAIDETSGDRTALHTDLLRVAAAATVEPISRLRRDGRALRYWPDKPRCSAIAEFSRRVSVMDDDISSTTLSVDGEQFYGDAREFDDRVRSLARFDLAIFSPPYPNNIDYTEVYKLENWLLGYITSSEGFRSQRLRTVHSHPSIRRGINPESEAMVSDIVGPLVAMVPDGRYRDALVETIVGYVVDMDKLFASLGLVIRPGGHLVFAVGNSAHGSSTDGVVVAADVLLTALAQRHGFTKPQIEVARRLTRKRHESEFLRESVCILRREN